MNLPNKLTILRIIMIPFFIFFFLSDMKYGSIIGGIIFVIAALTDMLDGHIARKYKLITTFGKFMDPLADKLLVCSALICLVETGDISSWVAIIIIAREFAVTGLRVLAASDGIVIAASWWGKIKTITQMVAIVSLLFGNWPFESMGIPFGQAAMYLAVLFTIISGYDYFRLNKQVFSGMS
ncbi:CDP-diacylglycerol--glycerol-3-phosphate 3-phosphatidyltransferase [Alkalibacter rhizosphaerae]|uniref:CDP-diacylglycerol--glycerol-3-phosphate 3-phosphatidyltransferase n=1 Tax=Alkalibacter rhizosphaerae TaxID=2815577 RepID=A0A974XH40_9FIRM|nr:CDP-diacylglycerol--glycerol-3-phosphate 3-phosphatidyltransferase [Alkalibacter rhizosphaerae]QSX08610.1 CDP-diacylglycerol--glycerol-3-phosphate 3-phosphatidyltransferase [Alkalibacter rhizosphaerae]